MTKEERKQLIKIKYLEENKSINQIAKELKIGWDTVKRNLISEGVEIQTNRNQYIIGNSVSDKLFMKIETEEDAYWLGFLYADGWIREDRNEIGLQLQERDEKHIEHFKNYCKCSNAIYTRQSKSPHYPDRTGIQKGITFSNRQVKENLIKLGCLPNKSLILKFPNLEQVPLNLIKHFIRGYVDGDGNVRFGKRNGIVILGTFDFLSEVQKIFNQFCQSKIRNSGNSQVTFRLEINKKQDVIEILNFLYLNSNIYLERKYQEFLKTLPVAFKSFKLLGTP